MYGMSDVIKMSNIVIIYYAENYDYPEEWISESPIIDDWIFDNEIEVYKKLREILLKDEVAIEIICRSS